MIISVKNKKTDEVYCDKCGHEVQFSRYFSAPVPIGIYHPRQTKTYRCSVCGFVRKENTLIFGFSFKYPNYYSLTSHAADKLFFADGSRLSLCITEKGLFQSPQHTKDKWDMWIKENTVDIIKLAAISDENVLGCNDKIKPEFNPITYLLDEIVEQKKQKFTFLTMKKTTRKKPKIDDAIKYAFKHTSEVLWFGGSFRTMQYNYIENLAIRKNIVINNVFHYKSFNIKDIAIYKRLKYEPLFISGPSLYVCEKQGYTQDRLDKYISEYLTAFDNSLNIDQKLKIVMNTGNSGVDTSVLRWAINNDRYAIVVNLMPPIHSSQDGSSLSETVNSAIRRILQ